jgi:hypothetical protein
MFLVQNLQGPWRTASPRSRRTMTASRDDQDE